MPQCLPVGIKYFNYSKANYFKINKKIFSKKIFNTTNLSYVGNKKFFRYGTLFACNVTLKKKYKSRLNFYLKNISATRRIILNLKIYLENSIGYIWYESLTLPISKANKKYCS